MAGYNQLFLIAVMPTILTFTFYWTSGLFFTLLDHTGWLSKYKIQPGKIHRQNRQFDQSGTVQSTGDWGATGNVRL
jgi:hypothetical protein